MDLGAQHISDIQLYDKYARWIPELERRETWVEVTQRVMGFLKSELKKQNKELPAKTWAELGLAMGLKDVLPSMRVVQMAGPALERCHVGAFNCAYLELDSPKALGELLYILMQGTGVGYSVEKRATAQWPTVSKHYYGLTRNTYKIADTTEGWCWAFVNALVWGLDGYTGQFDYSLIRPEGAWLHTKGGRASGPEPLKSLLQKTDELLRAAAGRQLRPFEIHRLATLCGSIVQVGGVRRAAEIALFDQDDHEMRECKNGEFWTNYPELAMANNSMVFNSTPSPEEITEFTYLLAGRGTGEPGIFRQDGAIPARRGRRSFGTNPCGEITLRSKQFCNLSIAVARPEDGFAHLLDKVRLAAVLGTIQSCLTKFNFLSPEWAHNTEEERLLGVDITGTMDCPILQLGAEHLEYRLSELRGQARLTNELTAQMLGIAASVAVTCNKPSGNSSQLIGASSGIHPRYADFYVRRLRIAARSPLGLHLYRLGIPCYPEVSQGTLDTARVWVFELPVASPPESVTRNQLSAKSQLEYWASWKLFWTEHNPSCTIYVKEDEWADVEAFLRGRWAIIGGLSFLPADGGIYKLAPYEEITQEEYERRLAELPVSLNLSAIRERIDLTTMAQDYSCTAGGICEL